LRPSRWPRDLALTALVTLAAGLALPVFVIAGSWLALDAGTIAVWRHLADTVLPGYAAQSALLLLATGVGVAAVGVATATAVALFEFPGRRTFEWALLLPLAMPAYVLAYAWTDALQFSGPVQVSLRQAFGLQGALWPDVRSLPGAVVLFVLALYPYVFLLTRAALAERALPLLEAARLLGAGPARRFAKVALPLARPAIVAGVALAGMEVLADYGVGAYFGLTTFTTGILRAWLVMGDRAAAAQLATLLLLLVGAVLWLERRAQRRLRFALPQGSAAAAGRRRLAGRPAALAIGVCAVPVLLGFVLPTLWLARLLWQEAVHGEVGLPLARFADWTLASLRFGAIAAVAATALALAIGFALRTAPAASPSAGWPSRALRVVARMLSLGYAVPGAVVAIGLLLPLAWWQQRFPQESWPVALVTGSAFGVLFAYLTRFSAVAMQSVDAGYARVPVAFDETARTLATPAWRLFARLHLPLLKRSALAAGLLVFVDVMKELPATLVLRPFGSDTLAVVAYNLARDERLGEAALPALAIVAAGLLPVALLARAMRAEAR
jgi:iron(III) transport system permease protein